MFDPCNLFCLTKERKSKCNYIFSINNKYDCMRCFNKTSGYQSCVFRKVWTGWSWKCSWLRRFSSPEWFLYSNYHLCVTVTIPCVTVTILCVTVTILCVTVKILCVTVTILCVTVTILCITVQLLTRPSVTKRTSQSVNAWAKTESWMAQVFHFGRFWEKAHFLRSNR